MGRERVGPPLAGWHATMAKKGESMRNIGSLIRRDVAEPRRAFWRVVDLTFRFALAALMTLAVLSLILGAIHFAHAPATWQRLSRASSRSAKAGCPDALLPSRDAAPNAAASG